MPTEQRIEHSTSITYLDASKQQLTRYNLCHVYIAVPRQNHLRTLCKLWLITDYHGFASCIASYVKVSAHNGYVKVVMKACDQISDGI